VNRRTFVRSGIAAGSAVVAAGGYARFVEPTRVEFTHHRPDIASAPAHPAFVQISDLHLNRPGSVHQRIAAEINGRQPGAVLITGDSVNGTIDLAYLDEFLQTLPPVPKFAILGNWERWGAVDTQAFSRVLERVNGRLLINESILHDDVLITGLDDLVGGQPDLGRALTGVPDAAFRLLLAHCPAQRDLLPGSSAFDLVLSGHTHGGQVRFAGFAPATPPGSGRYVAGWYRGDGPAMYVSRGVGTSVVDVRFGCRPEVAFFTL
jgi:uncharacterized protein